ncbi:MAG: FG-GAP repeat protein, partial [Candidatus Binatia bacterium]
FKLTASDPAPNQFGSSVAISGNIAMVGGPADSHAGISFAGSAYLFDVTTGQQLTKLTASDAAVGDSFGVSVAISGNFAVVGAAGGNGSAYQFDVRTHEELIKLTASDAAEGHDFGASVSLSGSRALVGSPGAAAYSGAAYMFSTIPEPASLALLALGLPLLVGRDLRRSGSGGSHRPLTLVLDRGSLFKERRIR